MQFKPKDRTVTVGLIQTEPRHVGYSGAVVVEPDGRAYLMSEEQLLAQFELGDDASGAKWEELKKNGAAREASSSFGPFGMAPGGPNPDEIIEMLKNGGAVRMQPMPDGGFEFSFKEPPKPAPALSILKNDAGAKLES